MGFLKKAGIAYLGANLLSGGMLLETYMNGNIQETFHDVAAVHVTDTGQIVVVSKEGDLIPVFEEVEVGQKICSTAITFGYVLNGIFETVSGVNNDGLMTLHIANNFVPGIHCDTFEV